MKDSWETLLSWGEEWCNTDGFRAEPLLSASCVPGTLRPGTSCVPGTLRPGTSCVPSALSPQPLRYAVSEVNRCEGRPGTAAEGAGRACQGAGVELPSGQ